MINYKVEILEREGNSKQWVEYKRAVFPFKIARLLDEQLDEANLTLKYIDKAYFKPQTLVRITITNKPEGLFSSVTNTLLDITKSDDITLEYNSRTKKITETKVITMRVANDNAIEVIGLKKNGVKKYNHEIYLIELTKILEGYIGESITFTNTLGNNYLDS